MKMTWRILTLAMAGLPALGPLGVPRARAQWAGGSGASISGSGYSYSWGYVPGYGRYIGARVSAGGVTSAINIGSPPVYVVGPGFVYRGPYGPTRGASISGPGYATSWGYTPGFGNFYNSTVSAGGVTSSIHAGYPPVYIVGPGIGYGGPYGWSRGDSVSNRRAPRRHGRSLAAVAPRLPFVAMPTFNVRRTGYR